MMGDKNEEIHYFKLNLNYYYDFFKHCALYLQMTDKTKHNILGLTTQVALAKLHNDIKETFEKFNASQNFR